VVPEQTVELVAAAKHASVVGISDHFEALEHHFDVYANEVRLHGLYLGTEVDGSESVNGAIQAAPDYFIYHCRDATREYKGAEKLVMTGKPVIIAHPLYLDTDFNKLPPNCLIEISNRYVWRSNWRKGFMPILDRFRFVISSDAHQPNWLGQSVAQYVAKELGIAEKVLFEPNMQEQVFAPHNIN
jgi:hypothetical protein